MGVNRRGYRGNFWTDDEVAILLEMADQSRPQIEIAETLGRSVSSIEGKLRLVREGLERGDHGMARYQAPPFVENDERKHLEAVLSQGGFRWKVLPS